jgi:hypothetical protein
VPPLDSEVAVTYVVLIVPNTGSLERSQMQPQSVACLSRGGAYLTAHTLLLTEYQQLFMGDWPFPGNWHEELNQ